MVNDFKLLCFYNTLILEQMILNDDPNSEESYDEKSESSDEEFETPSNSSEVIRTSPVSSYTVSERSENSESLLPSAFRRNDNHNL